MNLFFFLLVSFCLIELFLLSMTSAAMKRLSQRDCKKIFKVMKSLFLYRNRFTSYLGHDEWETIRFSLVVAQNVAQFTFLVTTSYWLFQEMAYTALIALVALFLLFYTFSDFIPRMIGARYPVKSLRFALPFTSPFLTLCFPITLFFNFLSKRIWKTCYIDAFHEPLGEVKQQIFEMLQESDLPPVLSAHDRQLIQSVIRFQTRIAREIMIPRINIFSLEAKVSIKEAVTLLEEQGYSRVPVYKETIDEIIGVLMYKDILKKYIEFQEKGNDLKILETPIETIVKPVMYTPETKKISNLLQDFRKKQMHLSIVVDEYGGTEGIVTIEDILEEIVGEIEDEYDEEEDLFVSTSDHTFIVDARMTINDMEEQLGVKIPQDSDYDTLGGYIFHQAGAIPQRGFTIKLDNVEIEVLKSNERKVEKVKIKKTGPK